MLKDLINKTIVISVVILIILMFIVKIIYDINTNGVINAKEEKTREVISLSQMVDNDDYIIQRLCENFKSSNIEIYYPKTKYEILNNEINNYINSQITAFKENINDDGVYSLFINFNMYKYNKCISFVFHITTNYGGLHPNTQITTINYNTKTSNLIDITTLTNKNNNILNLLSKFTYESLLNNDKIKEINMVNMLEDGTKANLNNFRNFVITKDGLIVFFEKYQIAPYAYGEFSVLVPYNEINLKFNK